MKSTIYWLGTALVAFALSGCQSLSDTSTPYAKAQVLSHKTPLHNLPQHKRCNCGKPKIQAALKGD